MMVDPAPLTRRRSRSSRCDLPSMQFLRLPSECGGCGLPSGSGREPFRSRWRSRQWLRADWIPVHAVDALRQRYVLRPPRNASRHDSRLSARLLPGRPRSLGRSAETACRRVRYAPIAGRSAIWRTVPWTVHLPRPPVRQCAAAALRRGSPRSGPGCPGRRRIATATPGCPGAPDLRRTSGVAPGNVTHRSDKQAGRTLHPSSALHQRNLLSSPCRQRPRDGFSSTSLPDFATAPH